MNIKITYKIYETRKSKGLTVRELSELSGVGKSQVSDIENGVKDTTVATLCKLAVALEQEPHDLFNYKIME